MEEIILPPLPYDPAALEPVISAAIMTLHHDKHHQAYVNNLNAALKSYREAEQKSDLASMIALEKAIRFNGGGHLNHSIFWHNLAPKSEGGGQAPTGQLADAIKATFGSLESFKEELTARSIAIQGSGWGWLCYHKEKDKLVVATCDNQDPLATQGLVPLLGIDVWEHAYYLQYKNVRPDYVKAIWSIINWKNVADRYEAARKK